MLTNQLVIDDCPFKLGESYRFSAEAGLGYLCGFKSEYAEMTFGPRVTSRTSSSTEGWALSDSFPHGQHRFHVVDPG